MDLEFLETLYNMCHFEEYEMHDRVFSVGAPCECVYIVIQGVLQINLTNGYKERQLDIMGQGSVIGSNFVIRGDIWYYNCVSVSREKTILIQIPQSTIYKLNEQNRNFAKVLSNYVQNLQTDGVPQIDYLIGRVGNEDRKLNLFKHQSVNFKKY